MVHRGGSINSYRIACSIAIPLLAVGRSEAFLNYLSKFPSESISENISENIFRKHILNLSKDTQVCPEAGGQNIIS
jgi:hypothetical protein